MPSKEEHLKILKIGVIGLAVYMTLALLFGAAVGYLQPQDVGTTILRTFDAEGHSHETVVRVVTEDDGQLWILSGGWFRGWYNRALINPDIELVRDTEVLPLRAKAVTDPATVEAIDQLSRDGQSARTWWVGRALLLFAPAKVLRLDERHRPA